MTQASALLAANQMGRVGILDRLEQQAEGRRIG
jgi:hypothetical protein